MLESLDSIDRALFLFLNRDLANPVFDLLMPVVTSDNLLRVLYGLAMALLLWKGNTRVRWMVLFSGSVLVLTDQASSHLLKPMIGRLRPCHVLESINLLVGCGGGKAMPSSHASNALGQAFLFSLLAPKHLKWYLYAFAGTVAISRVFVGVHYPGDVVVGSVLGAVIGTVIAILFKHLVDPRLQRREAINKEGTESHAV